MWPMSPPTTMSTPFIEIPQRAAALPSITSRPPCAVAPADWEALPFDVDRAGHHVLGDADARVADDRDLGLLVHSGGVVADVAVDGDRDRCVEADRDVVCAMRVRDDDAPDGPGACSAAFSSRTGVVARSKFAPPMSARAKSCHRLHA